MAKTFQFDDNPQAKKPLCVACEEMLPDALDQTLPDTDQLWFDQHTATCSECSAMLADAQRGAAWLELLKAPRPEPSAALLERILAQTAGNEAISTPAESAYPATLPQIQAVPTNLLSFRPRTARVTSWMPFKSGASFDPRLAMTAAMAFFSIALTLNLTGVRLDRLNAKDLSPSGIKRTYYQANADAVRYYDNLRVVRTLESRVDTLRDTNDDAQPAQQQNQDAPKPEPGKQPANQPDPQQENRLEPGIAAPAKAEPGTPISRLTIPVDPRIFSASRSISTQEGGLL